MDLKRWLEGLAYINHLQENPYFIPDHLIRDLTMARDRLGFWELVFKDSKDHYGVTDAEDGFKHFVTGDLKVVDPQSLKIVELLKEQT